MLDFWIMAAPPALGQYRGVITQQGNRHGHCSDTLSLVRPRLGVHRAVIELPDIEAFLGNLPGFASLDSATLSRAARGIEVEYFRKGTTLLTIGTSNDALHLVRSGAVQLTDADGELVARLSEGESFGLASLMNDAPARFASSALEDSLIYRLNAQTFRQLRQACAAFDTHAVRVLTNRLVTRAPAPGSVSAAGHNVRDLMTRAPVTVAPDVTVREAARLMSRERVSALMVVEAQKLSGIVTDRDLRNRVIAAGTSSDVPVRDIMTSDPVRVAPEDHAYDGALAMMQHHIHHLPVARDGVPLGLVSRSDFMRAETEHPLYLVKDLARAQRPDDVVAACRRLPELIASLIDSNASGAQLGRFITAITDAATRQFLKLGEAELGAPPLPYAWVALGSQARQEQSAHSDQDNAMIIDADEAQTARHDDYFKALARRVNDGLNACGYVYCPGGIMGQTDKWRTGIGQWRHYFHQWIHVPEEKALMHANIFFDLRCVAGKRALVDDLKNYIAEQSRHQQIFLALMSRNALGYPPPLGFFKQFVLERSGEHRNTLNLKLNGIMPIVEIARIRSLACGQMRVGTRNRLRACAEAGEMTREDARSLIDALDLLDSVRLHHQSAQLAAGDAPDNHLAPDALSPLARQNLKAAFSQIRTSQAALAHRFGSA